MQIRDNSGAVDWMRLREHVNVTADRRNLACRIAGAAAIVLLLAMVGAVALAWHSAGACAEWIAISG